MGCKCSWFCVFIVKQFENEDIDFDKTLSQRLASTVEDASPPEQKNDDPIVCQRLFSHVASLCARSHTQVGKGNEQKKKIIGNCNILLEVSGRGTQLLTSSHDWTHT